MALGFTISNTIAYKDLPRLMVVTCGAALADRTELIPRVVAAVRGGAGLVQVREKDLDDAALSMLLTQLRDRLEREGLRACFVVNDRPHVARAFGLGHHLPEGALRVADGAWWGRSVHCAQSLCNAAHEGAHYAVLGTLFPTASKPGCAGMGMAGFVSVRHSFLLPSNVPPVFAIGGIRHFHVGELLATGAHGIAVSGSVLNAPDIEKVVHSFAKEIIKAITSTQSLLSI